MRIMDYLYSLKETCPKKPQNNQSKGNDRNPLRTQSYNPPRDEDHVLHDFEHNRFALESFEVDLLEGFFG